MRDQSAEVAIYRKKLKKRCLIKDIKYCFAYAINLDIENEQEQSKLYKELCDKNNFIPACAKLAENYRLIMSRSSDEKSIKKAYLYLKKACDGKDAYSCDKLNYDSFDFASIGN